MRSRENSIGSDLSHGSSSISDITVADFGFWVTVAFTLNYIIGSGFLTLPWAFEKAGILLGILILLLFAFFSTISTYFILETMERAQTLEKINAGDTSSIAGRSGYMTIDNPMNASSTHNSSTNPPINPFYRSQVTSDGFELTRQSYPYNPNSLYSQQPGQEVDNNFPMEIIEDNEFTDRSTSDAEHSLERKLRKKELTELCQMFLGDFGKQLYIITICIYMYGSLWAYSTVFANSFTAAAEIIFGTYSYIIYLILFGVLAVPLSLMEFSEQLYLQVALAIFRVIMVVSMVVSIIFAFNTHENEFQLNEDIFQENSSRDISILFRCNFSKIHLLMPVAAYSFIFHHSVPSLAEPAHDKTSLNHLFRTAIVISMVFYIALGMIISAYFGSATQSASNLNWKDYIGSSVSHGELPWMSSLVRLFVLLFPAMDVASAFPLNAFTLGNNLMAAYYGKNVHLHDKNRKTVNFFRAIAAVPPILGAFFVSDLGKITGYTGLTGFALAFVFPPLLAYASYKKLRNLNISTRTLHTNVWTNKYCQLLLFFSGIGLILYVGIVLLYSPTSP